MVVIRHFRTIAVGYFNVFEGQSVGYFNVFLAYSSCVSMASLRTNAILYFILFSDKYHDVV